MKKYHIIGSCHTDLAWRFDEEQYAVYLEQFVVLMIDLLEQYPDFTYVIEQAYHYRKLMQRRPDLVEKLKRYISQGRVEVVGGMISTMDTNMPCGESQIRNQLMGLNWFEAHMSAPVSTAWMYDAFGCHAQTPQMIAGFGMHRMMGSRFGGDKRHTLFEAEGLDGTRMQVAGRDCFTLNLPEPEDTRVFVDFVPLNHQVDALFDRARRSDLDGPLMVLASIEDETFPSRRLVEAARDLKADMARKGCEADFSTPRAFFDEVDMAGLTLPVESADMNPEFTGTYAQRIEIRMQNRRAEADVLDAEKWLALAGQPWPEELHDVWWDLGFVHFHDVFTGSHPERVFVDVMDRLARTRTLARRSLTAVFGEPADASCERIRVVNGLPFPRRDWVSVPFDGCAARVLDARRAEVPSAVRDGELRFAASVGPCSAANYEIIRIKGERSPVEICNGATLENEVLRLTVDRREGVTLVSKSGPFVALDGVKDLLVLQQDTGSFQIERIEGSEIHAWARPVRVERLDDDTVRASGAFTDADGGIIAAWTLTFELRSGEDFVGVGVRVDWRAEGMRLRLKLATLLCGAGDGVYEIPFGAVRRRAYVPAFNRKGEWPAQRFAAVEDERHGLALVNDGAPGVETLGGTIYTTLLRAPTEDYAGMVPDVSSQQHGVHEFRFALYPYEGGWEQSEVLKLAQRWNQPLRAFRSDSVSPGVKSLLSIDNDRIILQAVKPPEKAGEKGVVLRLYEGAGEGRSCRVTIPGAVRAWAADLRENRLGALRVEKSVIPLDFKPWQIRTIIVERECDR